MRKFRSIAVILMFGLLAGVFAEEPKPSQTSSAPQEELTPEAQKVAEELKATLPEGSEGRAMLDHIIAGSRLGPGEGWFRLAVSQTRHSWDSVLRTYDANGDDRISLQEFRGNNADFARLDRDLDDRITEADFDWSADSLTMTPGYLMFFRADQDANGKITSEEFQTLFHTLDGNSQGYLALDDLRDQFQPPTEEQYQKERTQRSDRPSRSTLVLALKDQEIGSLQPGPKLNETAPDFTLKSLGGEDVTLSKEVGEQPIVLIFGNFTCGPFRSQSGNLEKLYQRYKDRAKFYLVYVREAHPSDAWWMNSNERVGIKLPQPQSTKERRDVAQTCQKRLDLKIPFLVDTIDDSVGATYSGMPNRLYLIDQKGKVAFKNGRGPFGFHPRQLEQALVLLLNQNDSTTPKTK
jgi:Ca2+-binding EF-hand superfamily protein